MPIFKRILVIYENIPESTDLFLLLLTEEEFKRYSCLAGQYINHVDITAEILEVAMELQNKLYFKEYPSTPGEWAGCKIDNISALNTPFDGVIQTGFLL